MYAAILMLIWLIVTGCYIKLVDIASRDLLPTPLH